MSRLGILFPVRSDEYVHLAGHRLADETHQILGDHVPKVSQAPGGGKGYGESSQWLQPSELFPAQK